MRQILQAIARLRLKAEAALETSGNRTGRPGQRPRERRAHRPGAGRRDRRSVERPTRSRGCRCRAGSRAPHGGGHRSRDRQARQGVNASGHGVNVHRWRVDMTGVSCPDAQDQAGYPPSSSTWSQAGDRAPKTANWPSGPPDEAAPALARLAHQNFAAAEIIETRHRSPLAGMARQTLGDPRCDPAERRNRLLRPCPYPCCSADRACCGCCGP